MKRRDFINLLMSTGVILPMSGCWFGAKKNINTTFLSACDIGKNKHAVGLFDSSGKILFITPTPGRCHGSVPHLSKINKAVVFARRPGDFLLEIDLQTGELSQVIQGKSDRHFYGHGCFSHDGQYLITTENDFIHQRGLVVIRDADNYQVLEEFSSGGIGPHECAMLNHNNHLVVANGGILTHPQQARKKLNLSSMQPNLSYIELPSGKLLESFKPDHHQLSIRHLAVSQNDLVVIGLQYQGKRFDRVPLVLSHHGKGELKAHFAPENIQLAMKQYTASVAIDDQSNHAVVTCPRGHIVTLWDLPSGQFKKSIKIRDTAGVAYDSSQQQFLLTNGFGAINQYQMKNLESFVEVGYRNSLKWDNHLSVMSS
ncbi:DUF1513 domain-containing protein [Aliikangiella sp. IMCC44359]|uniref:DUF1513 domain-containing protein n=1 Tax=Aliikangiella sp. IMCC44359 TaxID=3459125 RepID=UPI00403AE78D